MILKLDLFSWAASNLSLRRNERPAASKILAEICNVYRKEKGT
jgi:hypothetical protein